MAREIELLCLASSYKNGGRCIAGIDLEGEEWIRPVSERDSGTIAHSVYFLAAEGRAVEPLDVLSLRLREARPEPSQPENWVVADEPWQLVEEWDLDDAVPVIDTFVSTRTKLFGSSGNSLREDDIPARGVKESLVLVEVDQPSFYVARRYMTGSAQLRVQFELGREHYDLPLTDMAAWATELRDGGVVFESSNSWYFTVSLAPPWNGACYKLVAAGIEIEQ